MDDDKPFVCMETGCGQRFTNEDHLSVHMRKHEMSLALNPGSLNLTSGTSPSRAGGLILDQTPTPTKFLRNCEEIGLFQELRNPFEEAFKKALDTDGEQGLAGIPLPGPSGGENELNTPVPHIARTISEIGPFPRTKRLEKSKLTKSEPLSPDQEIVVIDKDHVTLTQSKPSTVVSSATLITAAHSTTHSPPKTTVAFPTVSQLLPQSQCTMQIFLQLPNGQTVPVQIPASIPSIPVIQPAQQASSQQILTTTSTILPQTTQQVTSPQKSQTSFTKQKLKQAIQQQTLPSPISRPTSQIIQVSPESSVNSPSSYIGSVPISSPLSAETSFSSDTSSPTIDSTQLTPRSGKRSRRDENELDGRRKKFLERNRAAAARCRAKRKTWINNLEKRSSDLQNNNNKLQGEINLLRAEVANLKTLLLAHKDCPVTQALQKQGIQLANPQTETEQNEDIPINLTTKPDESPAITITPITNIPSHTITHTISHLSAFGRVQIAPSQGDHQTVSIPSTIFGNAGEQQTIRILPAVITQEGSKAVRKK